MKNTILGQMFYLVAFVTAALQSGLGNAEELLARAASGHGDNWGHVKIVKDKFLPVIQQRIGEETGHSIDIIQAWGGVLAKGTEVLEAVETGVATFGVYCVCHDSEKLKLHNFMFYLPFGPTSTGLSVAATRRVYDKYPQFEEAFERHNQKLLALIPQDGYGLVTKFKLETKQDVIGKAFGGAGPNLSWIGGIGRGVAMQGTEGYTGLETGLVDGTISSPTIAKALKLYEVAPYYNDIGFGSMTIVVLTVNRDWFDGLPADVQAIIHDTALQLEAESGPFWDAIEREATAENLAHGQILNEVPEDVRITWAESLVDLPTEKAAEIGKEESKLWQQVMQAYYEAALELGHHWPVRYNFQ